MSRRHRSSQRAAQLTTAQTARARSNAPALPAGASYRPIQTQPQPPAYRQPATASQYGVITNGQTPGQNLQGDNSAPASAYTSPRNVNWPAVFPPGDPLRPIPGLGMPRQFAYPVGSNISMMPRQTESTSFEVLRNLAALYEGIQLCEAAIFRVLERLELQIAPRPEVLGEGEDMASDKWATPARYMQEWFAEGPDKRTDLTGWMIAAFRDLLELDALGVFHHRTRGGGLYALEPIAGDTLMCLTDAVGRRPLPPAPAYQQILYGGPGALLTADEMDYLRITTRTDSMYGISPVERILLRVNQALRKESYDLRRYTDGATPEGVLQTSQPELITKMSLDDVQTMEQLWNSVLAGNDALRVRTKVVPPGWSFTSTAQPELATEFDAYVLNVTVAAFGLTKDELGFTDTSNRSTGDAQQAVVYRNAVRPRSDYLKRYFTQVIRRYDGQPLALKYATISRAGSATKPARGVWDARFCARWNGIEEPEDFGRRVSAYVQLVRAGIVGPTQAKRELGIAVEPNETPVPAFVAIPGGSGSIVFPADLEDQRDKLNEANEAALDAKIASSKQVQQAMENGGGGGAAGVPGQPSANPIAAQAQLAGKPQQAAQATNGGVPPSQGQGKGMGTPQQAAQQQLGAKVASAQSAPHKPLPIEQRGQEAEPYEDRVSTERERDAYRLSLGADGERAVADDGDRGERVSADGGQHAVGRSEPDHWSAAQSRDAGTGDGTGADGGAGRAAGQTRGVAGDAGASRLRGEADRRAGLEDAAPTAESGQIAPAVRGAPPAQPRRQGRGAGGAAGDHDHASEHERGQRDAGRLGRAERESGERDGGTLRLAAAAADHASPGASESGEADADAEIDAEVISEEWRRYRERALKAVKRGEPVKEFISTVLPCEEHRWVAAQLQDASTADEVRAIFQQAREGAFVDGAGSGSQPEGQPHQDTGSVVSPAPSSAQPDPIGQLAAALAARLDAMTETRLREMRTQVLDAIGAQ